MYMTFLAASPCAKTVAFFSNLATFLPSPAESRNSFTSNVGPLAFAFRAECGEALTDRRRTAEEAIPQNTSAPHPGDCSILHSHSSWLLLRCCFPWRDKGPRAWGQNMQMEQVYNHWNCYVERLQKKWIEFSNGILFDLAQEEMKIRREEVEKQIESQNHPDAKTSFRK